MEGMACGCQIEIAPDNPKLQSLLDAGVQSHEDYADSLLFMISQIESGRKIPVAQKYLGQLLNGLDHIRDKAGRAPQTLRIRSKNLFRKVASK